VIFHRLNSPKQKPRHLRYVPGHERIDQRVDTARFRAGSLVSHRTLTAAPRKVLHEQHQCSQSLLRAGQAMAYRPISPQDQATPRLVSAVDRLPTRKQARGGDARFGPDDLAIKDLLALVERRAEETARARDALRAWLGRSRG
jgi:hypothetical protein